MYNILVQHDTNQIKDYDRDYTLFNNVIIASKDGEVALVYSDLSSADCNVHQVNSEIINFVGNKFLYVDGEVIQDPDWEELEV